MSFSAKNCVQGISARHNFVSAALLNTKKIKIRFVAFYATESIDGPVARIGISGSFTKLVAIRFSRLLLMDTDRFNGV